MELDEELCEIEEKLYEICCELQGIMYSMDDIIKSGRCPTEAEASLNRIAESIECAYKAADKSTMDLDSLRYYLL